MDSYFTRPLALTLPVPCEPKAFWTSPKRLPEMAASQTKPPVPALLVKKGGGFPEFWKQPLAFPVAMGAVYEAIRKMGREW